MRARRPLHYAPIQLQVHIPMKILANYVAMGIRKYEKDAQQHLTA